MNAKRIYRLYGELGLQLRNETPKRRVKAKLREDRSEAVHSKDLWAMDFVHDQLATGRKIQVLTDFDTFSRFSPVVDPRLSYRGEDVVETLDQACRRVGYPKTIRVDQGSEFISRDLDVRAYQRGAELDFSKPGKPTDNAFIKSFNSKFRSEVESDYSCNFGGISSSILGLPERTSVFLQRVKLHPIRLRSEAAMIGPTDRFPPFRVDWRRA